MLSHRQAAHFMHVFSRYALACYTLSDPVAEVRRIFSGNE
jgi:hypothetical protein